VKLVGDGSKAYPDFTRCELFTPPGGQNALLANAHAKKYDTGLMWFRRDLRVDDNAALYHALKSCRRCLPVCI
jgi:hypothetical protein